MSELDETVGATIEFGNHVRARRIAAELGIPELAAMLGCTPATLEHIECRGLDPTYPLIMQIANATALPGEDLSFAGQ